MRSLSKGSFVFEEWEQYSIEDLTRGLRRVADHRKESNDLDRCLPQVDRSGGRGCIDRFRSYRKRLIGHRGQFSHGFKGQMEAGFTNPSLSD